MVQLVRSFLCFVYTHFKIHGVADHERKDKITSFSLCYAKVESNYSNESLKRLIKTLPTFKRNIWLVKCFNRTRSLYCQFSRFQNHILPVSTIFSRPFMMKLKISMKSKSYYLHIKITHRTPWFQTHIPGRKSYQVY